MSGHTIETAIARSISHTETVRVDYVRHVDGDIVTVAWDQGVTTSCAAADLEAAGQ